MKILITYSSLTGNTRMLAQGLYYGMEGKLERDILPMSILKERPELLESYDTVLAGYWVDKGKPNREAAEILKNLKGKSVGIFATLGAYPDSEHGIVSLSQGVDLIEEENTLLFRYICQGKLSEEMKQRAWSLPPDHSHYPDAKRLQRWADAESHPDQADIEKLVDLALRSLQVTL